MSLTTIVDGMAATVPTAGPSAPPRYISAGFDGYGHLLERPLRGSSVRCGQPGNLGSGPSHPHQLPPPPPPPPPPENPPEKPDDPAADGGVVAIVPTVVVVKPPMESLK